MDVLEVSPLAPCTDTIVGGYGGRDERRLIVIAFPRHHTCRGSIVQSSQQGLPRLAT